jgi:hypothetical protein
VLGVTPAEVLANAYWTARLGKPELRAYQASRRGGEIGCRALGDRVALRGACARYSEGHVEL